MQDEPHPFQLNPALELEAKMAGRFLLARLSAAGFATAGNLRHRWCHQMSMRRLFKTTSAINSTVNEKSGKAEVNGAQLYYEARGSGEHHVLCIPGALGTTRTDFGPQLEYFGRDGSGYTVIAFDPRGYGRSRPPPREFVTKPETFLKLDALDARELMQVLGIPKFSILGWSDGGASAMVLAGRFPDVVRKMVVWGANAFITDVDLELFEKTRDVANWSARMREPFEAMYGTEFPKMWSDWLDAIKETYVTDRNLCTDEVSKVSCPTLVVHGVKDTLCPMLHPEYIAKNIKDSKLELFPEGKHNVHLRYAKEFNELVDGFLKE